MKDNTEQEKEYEYYRSGASVLPFPDSDCSRDRIHFLPTSTSDAILLESAGHFALVDCAEDSDNPRGFDHLSFRGYEKEVLAYLKKNASDKDGKVHLDFILGTHAHSDHIGGFDTLLYDSDISVGRAYLKEYREEYICSKEIEEWDNREVYDQMLTALKSRNIPVISDIEATRFSLGNMSLSLFNTEYDTEHRSIGENDNSIGMLIEIYGLRVFLAADIDNKTGDEDRIAPQIGKIDILKVGHHSYSGSSTEGFLKTLSPDICIVTNDYPRTDKRTLDRIMQICHSPVLCTGDEEGIITAFHPDGSVTYINKIV